MRAGDIVLVHSASGGVGQSALQLCRRRGAKVIASAGTAEKRAALLEKWGDIIIATCDSHDSRTFVPTVMDATERKGVNVVLNSLAADCLIESLRCLAPGGVFCEIGKVDISRNTQIGLGNLAQNITFASCHLDLLADSHPEMLRTLLMECTALLESGELAPIDTEIVPFSQAKDSMMAMAKGKHSGKIVFNVEAETGSKPDNSPLAILPSRTLFRRDRLYLFTGATRGIGLSFALWAISSGARHVMVTGRSGALPLQSKLMVENMQKECSDIDVRVVACDIGDEQQLKKTISEANLPLGGIFHFATAYSAAPVTDLRESHIKEGLHAKAHGAHCLDSIAREYGDSCTMFVLFSSIAGLLGNSFQAVYSGANTALYDLVSTRQQEGLPAMVLDMPMVLGSGRLSRFQYAHELDLNATKGFSPASVQWVIDVVAALLRAGWGGHHALDIPAWSSIAKLLGYSHRVGHFLPPLELKKEVAMVKKVSSKRSSKTAARYRTQAKRKNTATHSRSRASAERSSSSPITALQLTDRARAKIAFLLGCDAADVAEDNVLTDLGVDSLAAVELSNWTVEEFNCEGISQTQILSGMTLRELVVDLARQVLQAPPAALSAQAQISPAEEEDDEDEMSEEEEDEEDKEEEEEDGEDCDDESHPISTSSSLSVDKQVKNKVAFLLGCSVEDIEDSRPLTEMGIDSLAAVELSNWVEETFNASISQTDILNDITLAAMIERLSSAVAPASLRETTRPKKTVKREKKVARKRTEKEEETEYEDEEESGSESEEEMGKIVSPSAALPETAGPRLREKIAFLLGCSEEDVVSSRPLTEMGIDSLAAVELSNWIEETFGQSVSQADILNEITLAEVTERVSSAPAAAQSLSVTTGPPRRKKRAQRTKKDSSATKAFMGRDTSPSTRSQADRKSSPAKAVPARAVLSRGCVSTSTLNSACVVDILAVTLNNALLKALLETIHTAVTPQHSALVLRLPHGCTGMDLSNLSFGTKEMDSALSSYARLYDVLQALPNPLVVVSFDAVRGGGMLFPCMADVSIAHESATFGFPELRQGALPGVVSVAARKRLSESRCKALFLTSHVLSAADAVTDGLVDELCDARCGNIDDCDGVMRRILGRLHAASASLVSAREERTSCSQHSFRSHFNGLQQSIAREGCGSFAGVIAGGEGRGCVDTARSPLFQCDGRAHCPCFWSTSTRDQCSSQQQ